MNAEIIGTIKVLHSSSMGFDVHKDIVFEKKKLLKYKYILQPPVSPNLGNKPPSEFKMLYFDTNATFVLFVIF